MEGQQPPSAISGPAGRRLHIAHRRSPSEMTPMIMEQLALQQQIELLQQQQQQIAATHQQYVNMGMIPQQQQLPSIVMPGQQGQPQPQMGQGMPQFQFPPQMQQQQQQGGMGGLNQSAHRRNQSAMPNMGNMANMSMGGPPPAPSTGASNLEYTGGQQQAQQQPQQGQRGGRSGGGGHQRRHSLALPEAKKAAELAQSKRTTSGFQFPIPGAGGASPGGQASSPGEGDDKPAAQSGLSATLSARPGNRMMGSHGRSQSMAVGGRGMAQGRGGSNFQFPPPMATNDAGASGSQRGGHGRSASRNFDGNWRQPNEGGDGQQPMGSFSSTVNPQAPAFQPGHRARPSMNQSISGIGGFQFPGQQQMMMNPQQQQMLQMQGMFQNGQLNPMQMQQLQALQAAGLSPQQIFGSLAPGQQQGGIGGQGQNQQQRKTLFTPYLPQASLPALLGDGQLVQGVLRVNKKNRSDAYVTCPELDADIFICGSKDRNRALEGDLVAIELLDVDEVWGQKKEKEEKKKRKDITDTRSSGLDKSNSTHEGQANGEGGLKRRGSLRQRPTQKKNDDVEVEGQSLLLMEEEEINDEAKPLYAGHVVAVIERIAGQMFSGTLGLLRPSSQATKEKQEAERAQRDGSTGRHSQDRQQDKPKIVWFKPTDKRVPLIAIPTEQAPRDFVERHQEYANRIFVACIKRWPITSLHPFGTLVEQLGEMGDLKVETDALLRDNNFGPDDFSDAVIKNIGFDDWSVSKESEEVLAKRRDFRQETIFTIDPTGTEALDDALHFKDHKDGTFEVGVHVADAAHFVKPNSLVDREAKKRGTGVFLMTRAVNMLPTRLANDICSLKPKEDRFAVSVVFHVDGKTGKIDHEKTWIGKSLINSSGRVTYDQVDAVIAGKDAKLEGASSKDISTLMNIAQKLRQARYGVDTKNIPLLRLLYQLDDENVPVEPNIFNSSPAHIIIEELSYLANSEVAKKIYAALPEKALIRRHATPKAGRLQTFGERMTKAGYEIDTTSSGTLQDSLFKIQDAGMRQGMETLLVKTMSRAKYTVPSLITPDLVPHFALNLPVYTHFTNPSRRYADIVVHRQLEAALNAPEGGQAEYPEDAETLNKLVDQCNTKKDSAHAAQEQSVHIEACRAIDKKRVALGADLITEGIVICVYESAFDVLIPEYGFEKRVHCDQLPLHKAEFRKETRVLELYWEKGVSSSAYIPEDERVKKAGSRRYGNQQSAAEAKAADDAHRKIDSHAISTDDVDALFEDDDDAASEITEATAGVSLNPPEQTQSVPQSPRRNSQEGLPRTRSEVVIRDGKTAESTTDIKSKYMSWFKLREADGSYIQDVTEMTRVPIILKTDLTKSPPCLTIRSVNPYAL